MRYVIDKCQPKSGCICDNNDNDELIKLEQIWSSFIDEFYCINLLERNDRLVQASDEFHNIGLCRLVKFYRTEKPKKENFKHIKLLGRFGCWESHRTVAGLVKPSSKNVLILEDDVLFLNDAKEKIQSLKDEYLKIKSEEPFMYFVGHIPKSGYLISLHTAQTKSVGLHAYILNKPGINIIKDFEYNGEHIDGYMLKKLTQYSYYPTLATQRFTETNNDYLQHFGVRDFFFKFYADHPRVIENIFVIIIPLLLLIFFVVLIFKNLKK